MIEKIIKAMQAEQKNDPYAHHSNGFIIELLQDIKSNFLADLKKAYVLQAAGCETDEERQENNKVIDRIEALITRLGMTPLKGEKNENQKVD